MSDRALTSIFLRLGPDNLDNLKKIAEQYSDGKGPIPEAAEDDDDDDEVPDLVEDFEQASKQ